MDRSAVQRIAPAQQRPQGGRQMGHVLVLGGARSGKTGFAERLAMRAGIRPAYLATAQALDAEMRDRVESHKQQRAQAFATIEEPIRLSAAIVEAAKTHDAILV